MSSPITPAHGRRLAALLLSALCVVAALAPLSHARTTSPTAHAAATCAADVVTVKAGYITSLKVTGTSCKTGLKVAKSFNTCRLKNGLKGKCTKKVRGYSCKENKRVTSTSPPEIDARVTCKKGKARVVLTYQTFLD
jgi:hypothetical protein